MVSALTLHAYVHTHIHTESTYMYTYIHRNNLHVVNYKVLSYVKLCSILHLLTGLTFTFKAVKFLVTFDFRCG
jgi:hypothetical protein